MFLIGAVTREAIIRKNGPHLPVEIDGWCSRGKCEWNSGEKSNEEMKLHDALLQSLSRHFPSG